MSAFLLWWLCGFSLALTCGYFWESATCPSGREKDPLTWGSLLVAALFGLAGPGMLPLTIVCMVMWFLTKEENEIYVSWLSRPVFKKDDQ